MISVVCCFWNGKRRPWQTYSANVVNVLARMVARNLEVPHEFVCMTNEKSGFDPGVKLAPLATELIPLGNAYPKLAVFKKEIPGVTGRRVLFLDIDTAITGRLEPVVDQPGPITMLREFEAPKTPIPRRCAYNSSVMLFDHGAFPEVWDKFDPKKSPAEVRATGHVGSDQVWISRVLGPDRPTWPKMEKVLSYKYHVRDFGHVLPASASIVCFHGRFKPWDKAIQAVNPWIADHWR